MRGFGTARTQAGYTLIELMIVLIIASVLLAITAPAFYSVITENRIRTQANRIVSSLNLARSTAAKDNIPVVFCASSDAVTCTGNKDHFRNGWLVYADKDGNGALTTGSTELIRAYTGLPAGFFLVLKNASTEITYYPDGSSSGEEVIVTCPSNRDNKRAWSVIINNLGSPRMKRPDSTWNCS